MKPNLFLSLCPCDWIENPEKVQLQSLQIQQFRNLEAIQVDTSAQFVVFHGDNGQGKTNLVEAVCALATLRSFRTHRVADQIRWGQDQAVISGTIRDEGHKRKLRLVLNKNGRKSTIDGKSPSNLANYFESIRAVVFAPQHVELVRGAPQQRRDFLDRGCFTLQPRYLESFRIFRRLLAQRSALLRGGRFDLAQMEVLEDQLACAGARISIKRQSLIEGLVEPFVSIHSRLTGQSTVGIRYRSCLGEGNESDRAEQFRQLMHTRREDEILRGSCLVGPQRDDLLVSLQEKNARAFASQGQSRALVIALKLAELDLAQKRGARPLFLLDDLSSELDAHRRARLVEILHEKALQVFVSTTNLSILEKRVENMLQYQVVEGQIVKA
jgi:DNA replication and repair protein RecF